MEGRAMRLEFKQDINNIKTINNERCGNELSYKLTGVDTDGMGIFSLGKSKIFIYKDHVINYEFKNILYATSTLEEFSQEIVGRIRYLREFKKSVDFKPKTIILEIED